MREAHQKAPPGTPVSDWIAYVFAIALGCWAIVAEALAFT